MPRSSWYAADVGTRLRTRRTGAQLRQSPLSTGHRPPSTVHSPPAPVHCPPDTGTRWVGLWPPSLRSHLSSLRSARLAVFQWVHSCHREACCGPWWEKKHLSHFADAIMLARRAAFLAALRYAAELRPVTSRGGDCVGAGGGAHSVNCVRVKGFAPRDCLILSSVVCRPSSVPPRTGAPRGEEGNAVSLASPCVSNGERCSVFAEF